MTKDGEILKAIFQVLLGLKIESGINFPNGSEIDLSVIIDEEKAIALAQVILSRIKPFLG